VRIAYTDMLDSKEDRREYLKKKYYFDCHCERCEDVERSTNEDSLNCGEILKKICPLAIPI